MNKVRLSTSGAIIGLLLACAVFMVGPPSVAQAQAPPVSDEEIDALFVKAAEAFKVGRYREALGALTRIAEFNPDPLILFNIARCHEELGELKEAEAAFVKALRADLPDAQRQETRDRLKALRTVLEKQALEEEEEEEARKKKQRGDKKEVDETPPPLVDAPEIMLALHAGVSLPQVFSALESTPSFGLEVAYALPFDLGPFVRPVELSLGVAFSKPTGSGSGFDTGLGESGSAFDWSLEQRTLNLDLGVAWRFAPLTGLLSIYVQTGPRLYLMESVLDASEGGVGFGVQREASTEVGFFAAGGIDLRVGPGSIFGALEISGRGVDDSLAGSTNTGALALELGYRVHF